ncbi:MAG: TonB-dependent receptor [Capnocytophaga sp.]|nr:TonB-dependent receptor [Capnocytophaga sp.]MDO5104634.1 TonB-dependent receptor [Capnocytophaga sp.]
MIKNTIRIKSLFLLLLLPSAALMAQNKKDSLTTKVIDVVKSYVPTIADAYKKREDANIKKDSLTLAKKEITYSIYSVPVASTFVPDKGKASTIKKVTKQETYQDSYIGGAFGNLRTIYGDASVTLPVSDESNLAFLFNHLSSNGEVKGIIPDNDYVKTSADARYDYLDRDVNWGVGLDFGRKVYHWYGVQKGFYTDEQLGKLSNIQQTYLGYGLSGYVKLADSYFDGLDLLFRGFSDKFDSSEINARIAPSFQVPISDGEQKIRLNLLFDYYSGSFARGYVTTDAVSNKWMLLGVNPSYHFSTGDLDLKLGATIAYAGGHPTQDSNFKAFPDVEVLYRIGGGNTIVHAAVRGMLQQNTFEKLTDVNPYLAPIQLINPTNVTMDISGALKGELTTGLHYKLQGGYKQYENLPLFTTYTELNSPVVMLGYQHNNSFRVVYDKVTEFGFSAGLSGNVSNIFFFDLEGKINGYSAKNEAEAWNLPRTRVSLFTDVKIIEGLFAGFDVFHVGSRYEADYATAIGATPNKLTLESYFDLNFHADYTLNKKLMIFVRANNLMSDNYQRWAYYPTHGFQVFGGVKYLFSLKK